MLPIPIAFAPSERRAAQHHRATTATTTSAPEGNFGTIVSGLKIPFPGNRDSAKQRLVRMRRCYWERSRIWCCSRHRAGKSARRVTPCHEATPVDRRLDEVRCKESKRDSL